MLLLLLSSALLQAGGDSAKLSPELRALMMREDSLITLGDSIVLGSTYEVREAACVAFIPTLVRALRTPGSYTYPFNRVRSLSVVQPEDKSFRVFTFQMMLWDYTYRYFGAIQYQDNQLRLTPLIDASLFMPDSVLRTGVLGPDEWYGALYYNISTKKLKGKTYYFLFGMDAWDMFSTRKLVDVLTFEKEQPQFGAALFPDSMDTPTYMNRFILEYKKDASASLNYDPELDQIVFDYLIPENPLSKGIKATYIPDGTYQGFKWEKDRWVYVKKMFDQMQAYPPDYTPASDPAKDPFNYERRIPSKP